MSNVFHLPRAAEAPAPMPAPAPAAPRPRNLLAERALLVVLTARTWTARKLDRKATDDVNSAAGAASDAGRFNKQLISKAALAKIAEVHSEARTFHYAKTRAWVHAGPAILPTALWLPYSAKMAEFRHRHESAVAAFLASYSQHIADAPARLGSLFNAEDYPPASEIGKRFAFHVAPFPVPDSADFRSDLEPAQAAEVRQSIESEMRAATAAAMRETWDKVLAVVGHMAAKLKETRPTPDGGTAPGIFRDSLVENVAELADLLPAFNFTGDPILADMADRLKAELCSHPASELRESEALRADTAKAAGMILEDIADYLA